MNIPHDDPRWTALVLGELDDDERAALENMMAHDPELRAEVDALQELAALLFVELAAEPMPYLLKPEQTEALESTMDPIVVEFPKRTQSWWIWAAAAAAIALVGAPMIWFFSVASDQGEASAEVGTKQTHVAHVTHDSLEVDPANVEALINEGLKAFQVKDYRAAAEFYAAASRIAGDGDQKTTALYSYALSLEKDGYGCKALATYEKILPELSGRKQKITQQKVERLASVCR